MLVEIKPLDQKKWHGKKGKDSFSQPKTVEVLYNVENGGFDTGLTEDDVKRLQPLVSVDLSRNFNIDIPHPFWSSKASWINLPNQTLVLNTARPFDEIKVANLKASKFVANSMKEYEEGLWPDATHVIFSEEEEMELKASKFQIQQQCSAKLMDISLDGKIALVQILSEKTVKSRGHNFIDGMMSEIMEEKPKELLEALSLGKDEVTLRAMIKELIQKGMLSEQKPAGTISYMGNQIATDFEDAVKYFKNPNNAPTKVRLLEKLKG